jgi:arsenate reductase
LDIVIYHNPDCSKSRDVLRMIRDAGYAPTIVEYLSTGWTRAQLLGLFAAAGLTPHTALRRTRSPAEALGLLDDDVSADLILEKMVAHPELVNRPIVACRNGVKLCRPAAAVLELLEGKSQEASV